MKLCTNCKSEIDEGTKYCPICGKEQTFIQSNNQASSQTNKNLGNQNVPGWLVILIIVFIIGFVFLGATGQLDSSSTETIEENEKPKYDTAKIYNVGEILNCPKFDISVDNVQIKVQGTYFNSYEYVADPEWIGVTVTVKNKSSETKTFYTSDFGLINSNGEVISRDVMFYNVWGVEKFDSPELVSGGSKTGFVVFTNTNQDNSNLILTVDCGTGLFEEDVKYKVNISQ